MLMEKLRGAVPEGSRHQFTARLLFAHETHGMLRLFLYRLDQALAQYFGEATEIVEQEEVYPAMPVTIRKCPQCNNDMVLKTKKNGGLVIFLVLENNFLYLAKCCSFTRFLQHCMKTWAAANKLHQLLKPCGL